MSFRPARPSLTASGRHVPLEYAQLVPEAPLQHPGQHLHREGVLLPALRLAALQVGHKGVVCLPI